LSQDGFHLGLPVKYVKTLLYRKATSVGVSLTVPQSCTKLNYAKVIQIEVGKTLCLGLEWGFGHFANLQVQRFTCCN